MNEERVGENTMSEHRPSDATAIRPSFFAKAGHPSCSRWGKTELEVIALAYVQALANNGDKWDRLTREQTYGLLTDEQKCSAGSLLTHDYYQRWFDMVADQITDADGAFGVGGFWPKKPR